MGTTTDLRAALTFAEHAAAVRTTDDVASVLLPALCRLLGCSGAMAHELDLATGTQFDVAWPTALGDPATADAYARVKAEHPLVHLAAEGSPVVGTRVSDLLSAQRWRSTAVYSEAMRRFRAEDQMSTTLTRRGAVADAVSLLSDGRPFTDRQRDLLLLVRPHLRAALRRTHGPGETHRLLAVGEGSRWVEVACTVGMDGAAATGPSGQEATAAGRPGALSEAERRVLLVAAEGLTSSQIARRVGCAPRTVEKHFEHAYLKLGVSNRVAALQLLGLPAQRPAPGLERLGPAPTEGTPGEPRASAWPPGCRLAAQQPVDL